MSNLRRSVLGALALTLVPAFAVDEAMMNMPKVKPVRTFVVRSQEMGQDLKDSSGFGEKAAEVRMMNLMMVEGSGYEGMEMSGAMAMKGVDHDDAMQMAPKTEAGSIYGAQLNSPTAARTVGTNLISISVFDSKTKAPSRGLKIKAQVYMTSMDMGVEEPQVREKAPGQYELKAPFSMNGPWAVKLILPNEEKVFKFDVTAAKK